MRCLLSVFVIAMIVGIGSLFMSTDEANAGSSPCTVIVEKVVIPGSGAQFDFLVDGFPSFTLGNGESFGVGLSIDEIVNITEVVTPGFLLQGITCSQSFSNCGAGEFVPCLDITIGPTGITAECLDNDVRTCTFTNVQISQVPTLSEWGLISTAAILGIMAVMFLYFRKRRAEV